MNYSFYDEMDELDDILNESTDEETFIESIEELFEEKASQLEYNIRRFKEKYNFNPKDSTIVVDGHKYKVDIKIKDPIAYVQGDDLNFGYVTQRTDSAHTNGTSVDSTPIVLGKNFFMLKDDKRRAALLQHEIGHQKLHPRSLDNPHLDKRKISSRPVRDECRDVLRSYNKTLGFMNKDDRREYLKNSDIGQRVLYHQKEKLKRSTANPKEQLDRNKARDAANKNVARKNNQNMSDHINAKEIEADRYAANKVGERYVKRGIRESYKQSRKHQNSDPKNLAINKTIKQVNRDKSIDKDNEDDVRKAVGSTYRDNLKNENLKAIEDRKDIKSDYGKGELKNMDKQRNKELRQSHREDTLDYKVRSKALKDKELRNNPSLK